MLVVSVLYLCLQSHADLVVENARIWSDGLPGFASFLAVKDGRFVYVGEHNPAYIGGKTMRVDAKGKIVIPGLIDSHVHMLNGGLMLSQLQLRDAKNKQDFIQRVAEWTKSLPKGKWVLGGRWSVESWQDKTQPTKEWIDSVTPDNPVYLPRMDGHSALVNSAALKIAGITKDTPFDPEGGVIDRHPVTKEPTGILRESAMGLVSRHIPPFSLQDKKEALKKAMHEANKHGITAVSDIPPLADLPVYEELTREGELTVRFFLFPTANDWRSAIEMTKSFQGKEKWTELRGFKTYLDGSLGSRTAMMREPFLNNEVGNENWRGLWREGVEDGTFLRNAISAKNANMQIIAHAIGDEFNHFLLNTMLSLYAAGDMGGDLQSLRNARCRSEHTQHLLPLDIARFGMFGMIASMQPFHKADDGRYCEDYIGYERSKTSYAFKSLLDAGAILAFGSDWPVVTLNPFLGMEVAVTGKILPSSLLHKTPVFWHTQENITVNEALRCYTSRGAYAVFAEHEIGKIAVGYRADFVILNSSPFDANVKWEEIFPLEVYVEGTRLPKINAMMNNTKNTKNKIFANSIATPAIPIKPKIPATMATIKKINAQ